jgi:predicted MPP superfamily phosphohydrolase
VAARNALGRVAVKRVAVHLRKLSPAQDGFRIVQLSDIHIGPTIGADFLAEIVRQTNELAPDIVAITGDLVDGSVADLQKGVAPLRNLRARHGVFFVTGNHEYFSGAAAWVAELGQMGIRVLRNERVTIGEGDATLDLAGTDDPTAHRYPDEGHGEDLAKALEDRDTSRPLVLLAHQPKTVTEAARQGVDLQLSGHTHGGQIWPFRYAVLLQQPVVAGLARFGETQIYVSRGTGYWGPPMRLAAPAEITEIVLRRAAS